VYEHPVSVSRYFALVSVSCYVVQVSYPTLKDAACMMALGHIKKIGDRLFLEEEVGREAGIFEK